MKSNTYKKLIGGCMIEFLKDWKFLIFLVVFNYWRLIEDSNRVLLIAASFILIYMGIKLINSYRSNKKNKDLFWIMIFSVCFILYLGLIKKIYNQYNRTKIIVKKVEKTQKLYYNNREIPEVNEIKNEIYQITNIFKSRELTYKIPELPQDYLETDDGDKIWFTFIYRSKNLCMIHLFTDNGKPRIIQSKKGIGLCGIILKEGKTN
jgi:predicted membrane protein